LRITMNRLELTHGVSIWTKPDHVEIATPHARPLKTAAAG
jgi:hypothetical protein